MRPMRIRIRPSPIKDQRAMIAVLQNPIFQDETKTREWLEARVWPNGPVCAHCGATDDDATSSKAPSTVLAPASLIR
jgi:hypothetical protein